MEELKRKRGIVSVPYKPGKGAVVHLSFQYELNVNIDAIVDTKQVRFSKHTEIKVIDSDELDDVLH